MPNMPKTIVVLGATGNQGGSVARTFLQHPEWHVRAVTRSPSSPRAAALAAAGASLVQADLSSPASLRAAFAGADAIFAVTDPLAIIAGASPDTTRQHGAELMAWVGATETQQLKNVADAAAAAVDGGLERLVWSTLPDVEALSGGKYAKVHHFTAKARAEAYAKERHPALWARTSSYLPGWFLRNVLPGAPGAPQKADDGTLLFAPGIKPTTRVPVFAPEEDAGPLVLALIQEPSAGKRVLGQRASMTFSEFLDVFTATTGHKTGYAAWPTDLEQLPLPVFLREPLVQMGAFWDEFGYEGGDASVVLPEDLTYPPVFETVAQYLEKNKWD